MLFWWGHAAHGDVEDKLVSRVQGARAPGHGAGRAPFGPLLENLQAPPRYDVLADLARGGREGTALGLQSGPPDHAGPWGPTSRFRTRKCYGEPFGIPAPDETLLVSWFAGGEVFRSGCTWKRGNGKIFYFRPGHESYPTYHQPEVQLVLRNAAHWARPEGSRWIDGCPNVPVEKAPEKNHGPGCHAAPTGRGGPSVGLAPCVRCAFSWAGRRRCSCSRLARCRGPGASLESDDSSDDPVFQAGGLQFVLPARWMTEAAANPVRAGQWRLPAARGGPGGTGRWRIGRLLFRARPRRHGAGKPSTAGAGPCAIASGNPVAGEVKTRQAGNFKISRAGRHRVLSRPGADGGPAADLATRLRTGGAW